MELILESQNLQDYLQEIPPVIQFNNPSIQERIVEIQERSGSKIDQARWAFEIARDEIAHSFDTKDPIVTINAIDVIENKEGICFAKAHLLATLLRGLGIPAGFCYQRVLRNPKDPESGHALHGLNALYLEDYGWFRVDPRGNKPGVNSQFSIEKEQLAYPIRSEFGEIDYPNVFIAPLDTVITSMKNSKTSQELFFNRPETL